jgi:urease subunit gamma/beta
MDGVPDLVDEVRLEVTLGDGTRLVVLRHPLGASDGTVSDLGAEGPAHPDRERKMLSVTNKGTRAIRVSSHFPFEQVNQRLSFDREAARGFHLDLDAGTTVRWAPGETRDVRLVRARD